MSVHLFCLVLVVSLMCLSPVVRCTKECFLPVVRASHGACIPCGRFDMCGWQACNSLAGVPACGLGTRNRYPRFNCAIVEAHYVDIFE